MSESTDQQTIKDEADLRVLEMMGALQQRGLMVRTTPILTQLEVRNPETGNDSVDVRYPSYPLTQTIRCALNKDDALWWWWIWEGRSATTEQREPMLPAADTEAAADKVARVLAAR